MKRPTPLPTWKGVFEAVVVVVVVVVVAAVFALRGDHHGEPNPAPVRFGKCPAVFELHRPAVGVRKFVGGGGRRQGAVQRHLRVVHVPSGVFGY